MRALRVILSMLFLFVAVSTYSGAPAWETVKSMPGTELAEGEHLDVAVRDGYIYIATSQTVTVKVMSILGQLISQQTLPAGVSRLKVGARGIYILKMGHITRRVTV